METINQPDPEIEAPDIEAMVRRVESLSNPSARSAATDLVQAVMGLHANALRRMLEIVAASGTNLPAELAEDDLISSILALHGLHPEHLGARVDRAMKKLHRYFDSRGGRIELVEASAEVVRVRVSGRNASMETAKAAVENTFGELVPEITAITIEGLEERDNGFVPLADLVVAQPS